MTRPGRVGHQRRIEIEVLLGEMKGRGEVF